MAILKLGRWLATALLALLAMLQLSQGNLFAGFALLLIASTMWWVPRIAAGPRKMAPTASADFTPSIAHDNIALDTERDTLWIRDASGVERYLRREDLLSWKSAHDWNNGTFRQRIEMDVRDVGRPRWQVLFQKHSDTWKKSSQKNGQERDEWLARLRAWTHQVPGQAAAQDTEALDDNPADRHGAYYRATSEVDRSN